MKLLLSGSGKTEQVGISDKYFANYVDNGKYYIFSSYG